MLLLVFCAVNTSAVDASVIGTSQRLFEPGEPILCKACAQQDSSIHYTCY